MILRTHNISWLVLLLTTSAVRSEYYNQCYNDTLDFGYTLCLSTDTSQVASWSEATTACSSNGSTLIDVDSAVITKILNNFTTLSSLSLSSDGIWIDVHSTHSLNKSWQWIYGATPPNRFTVNDTSNDPPVRWFAVITIRRASSGNNQILVYSAQTYDYGAAYICQFAGRPTVECVGGLVRNSFCYKKNNDKLTWFNASNSCLQQGGSLAIFADLKIPSNDADLMTWLPFTGNSPPNYWIGLILPWWQRHNGGNIQYSNWASSIPDTPSSNEQCVYIDSKNAWNTYHPCTAILPFVCQTIQPWSTLSPTKMTTTATMTTMTKVATSESSTQSTTSTLAAISSTPRIRSNGTSSMMAANANSNTSNVPIIVGVVVGVGVPVIIAVIILAVWFYVKKRHLRESSTVEYTANNPTPSMTSSVATSPSNNVIYADVVKSPQFPGHQSGDKPAVIQAKDIIYADLASPKREPTSSSPTVEFTANNPTPSMTSSGAKSPSKVRRVVYADVVKSSQFPGHQSGDKPTVVQAKDIIYADLASPK